MLLTQENSLCEKRQPVVVSRDKGNVRAHRAYNQDKSYDLRHYKLDGGLVNYEKCCDYLLVNDSLLKAYLIELKGGNIDEAIDQLEAGETKCKRELKGYTFFYRIVCTKAPTHKIKSSKVRKFKEKHYHQFQMRENILEETLS